jgi:hypothetical protein
MVINLMSAAGGATVARGMTGCGIMIGMKADPRDR